MNKNICMNLNAQWIVGFVDGEGCFHVSINQHKDMIIGFQVLPEFTVVQHQRDIQILYALKAHFKCGVIRRNHGDRFCYRVRAISHLLTIIIPFFDNHKLKTKKRLDFEKFRDVLLLMEKSHHKTIDGLATIRKIKDSMNIKNLRESPAFYENN